MNSPSRFNRSRQTQLSATTSPRRINLSNVEAMAHESSDPTLLYRVLLKEQEARQQDLASENDALKAEVRALKVRGYENVVRRLSSVREDSHNKLSCAVPTCHRHRTLNSTSNSRASQSASRKYGGLISSSSSARVISPLRSPLTRSNDRLRRPIGADAAAAADGLSFDMQTQTLSPMHRNGSGGGGGGGGSGGDSNVLMSPTRRKDATGGTSEGRSVVSPVRNSTATSMSRTTEKNLLSSPRGRSMTSPIRVSLVASPSSGKHSVATRVRDNWTDPEPLSQGTSGAQHPSTSCEVGARKVDDTKITSSQAHPSKDNANVVPDGITSTPPPPPQVVLQVPAKIALSTLLRELLLLVVQDDCLIGNREEDDVLRTTIAFPDGATSELYRSLRQQIYRLKHRVANTVRDMSKMEHLVATYQKSTVASVHRQHESAMQDMMRALHHPGDHCSGGDGGSGSALPSALPSPNRNSAFSGGSRSPRRVALSPRKLSQQEGETANPAQARPTSSLSQRVREAALASPRKQQRFAAEGLGRLLSSAGGGMDSPTKHTVVHVQDYLPPPPPKVAVHTHMCNHVIPSQESTAVAEDAAGPTHPETSLCSPTYFTSSETQRRKKSLNQANTSNQRVSGTSSVDPLNMDQLIASRTMTTDGNTIWSPLDHKQRLGGERHRPSSSRPQTSESMVSVASSTGSKFSTLRGDSELERYTRWKQDFIDRLSAGSGGVATSAEDVDYARGRGGRQDRRRLDGGAESDSFDNDNDAVRLDD